MATAYDEEVEPWTPLLLGSTGQAEEAHLHLPVDVDDTASDPSNSNIMRKRSVSAIRERVESIASVYEVGKSRKSLFGF